MGQGACTTLRVLANDQLPALDGYVVASASFLEDHLGHHAPITETELAKRCKQTPILVLHGIKDPFFNIRHAHETMVRLLNAGAKYVENGGKLSFRTYPEVGHVFDDSAEFDD